MRERISFLRKEIGAQKIHEVTGITPGNLSTWINGPSLPTSEPLEKLAACAKAHDERFSAAWLLTGEGQPFPPQRAESAEGQAALAAIAGRAVSMAVDGMRQLQAALPLLDAMPDLAAFDQAREDLDAALRDRTDKTRKVEVSEHPDTTTREPRKK